MWQIIPHKYLVQTQWRIHVGIPLDGVYVTSYRPLMLIILMDYEGGNRLKQGLFILSVKSHKTKQSANKIITVRLPTIFTLENFPTILLKISSLFQENLRLSTYIIAEVPLHRSYFPLLFLATIICSIFNIKKISNTIEVSVILSLVINK